MADEKRTLGQDLVEGGCGEHVYLHRDANLKLQNYSVSGGITISSLLYCVLEALSTNPAEEVLARVSIYENVDDHLSLSHLRIIPLADRLKDERAPTEIADKIRALEKERLATQVAA